LTWLQSDEAQLMRDRMSTAERRDDAVFISLTRTATLSITTAGVIVTWQAVIDSGGDMTVSGSSITVPIAGYYLIQIIGALDTGHIVTGDIVDNGVTVCTMTAGTARDHKFSHNVVRFFKAGDVVQYRATTSGSNRTLQVTTEDSDSESPIFHMVLL
jgi:hypothetical protein